MAMNKITVTIYTSHSANELIRSLSFGNQSDPIKMLSNLGSSLDSNCSINVSISNQDNTDASGTITFSSIANNDTITVGNVTFMAKTSGATGATQFNIGGSDSAAAINAANAINANTNLHYNGLGAYASANGAVITITAAGVGQMGNHLLLAISAHGSISAMSGGIGETNKISFSRR